MKMDKTKARIVTILMFALLVCVMYFIVTTDTTIGIVLLSGFGLYGLVSMAQDFMLWLQKEPTKHSKSAFESMWFNNSKRKKTAMPEEIK